MKYDLETTRMLSHASYLGFPREYCSNLTLYVTKNYVQLSVHSYYVRTSNIIYLSLSPADHSIRIWKTSFSIQCYFKSCLASEERFSRDWRPLYQRLVVRRRPSRTPLTPTPVFCLYLLPPDCLLYEKWTRGLKLFFQSRIGRTFPANSISIGSWLTNGILGQMDLRFVIADPPNPCPELFWRNMYIIRM